MILAILQARMSSTRLPGKVLAPVAGAPMILRQLERVGRARRIGRIVVATSDQAEDDVIEQTLAPAGVGVFRGPLDNVLERFVGAARAFGPASHIVRLTADCPLADPTLIDAVIELCLHEGADYASNTPPHRTYPKGLDVEVFTHAALMDAHARAATREAFEHVTWDLHRGADRYAQAFLSQSADEGEVRWTVDRPDDLDFVRQIYEALYPKHPAFTSDDIRGFVHARPALAMLGGDRRV